MIPGDRIFEVEWRVLRALNGWQLKAYMLLRNSEKALTCKEIAQALGTEPKNIWLALNHLVERYFLRRNGKEYELAHFGGTPIKDYSQIHEQKSQKIEQKSCFHEESFPRTPIKEFSPIESAKNARTHSHALGFYVSSLTDDPDLKDLAEEFLRGEIKRGEDLDARGVADLKRHFGNWLPKFKALKEIENRQQQHSAVQNEVKNARETDSENLQRYLDEQKRAAQSVEAREAAAAVLAKFGKKKVEKTP